MTCHGQYHLSPEKPVSLPSNQHRTQEKKEAEQPPTPSNSQIHPRRPPRPLHPPPPTPPHQLLKLRRLHIREKLRDGIPRKVEPALAKRNAPNAQEPVQQLLRHDAVPRAIRRQLRHAARPQRLDAVVPHLEHLAPRPLRKHQRLVPRQAVPHDPALLGPLGARQHARDEGADVGRVRDDDAGVAVAGEAGARVLDVERDGDGAAAQDGLVRVAEVVHAQAGDEAGEGEARRAQPIDGLRLEGGELVVAEAGDGGREAAVRNAYTVSASGEGTAWRDDGLLARFLVVPAVLARREPRHGP